MARALGGREPSGTMLRLLQVQPADVPRG
jgi:hypothetical protein